MKSERRGGVDEPAGPFVHRFAYSAPPDDTSPQSVTITYLAEQEEPTMVIAERLSPPMGRYVIVCSECRAEFGSVDAADAYCRFDAHKCHPT